MNELDRQIRDALADEDAWMFRKLSEEQSLQEMVADSFRGRHRWLMVLVYFWTAVFFALAVTCVVMFFRVDGNDFRELLMWGFGFGFFMAGVAALKTWSWMEMQKNTISREIKRVELGISMLAKLIDANAGGTAEGRDPI